MGLKPNLWQGKRVLITGHTGFKGSWLTLLLKQLGVEVIGISLPPNYSPLLYKEAQISEVVKAEYFQDIRNIIAIKEIMESSGAQYVFHMAAQAYVRKSFNNPLESFEINTFGTANVLKAALDIQGLEGITIVTTDKVYENDERGIPFKETDRLGGSDPYSASKAAAEIVVASLNYSINKFKIPITTVRAGNIIGGGDWGEDRLVPDIIRAISSSSTIHVRNPHSLRPWQYVLDCLIGYLYVAQSHFENLSNFPSAINFGPEESMSVMDLISYFEDTYKVEIPIQISESLIPEKQSLSLDSSLAREIYGWKPNLSSIGAIQQTANWYRKFASGESAKFLMLSEIDKHLQDLR